MIQPGIFNSGLNSYQGITVDSKPVVRWDVRCRSRDNKALLENGQDEYEFAGVAKETVQRVLKAMDGRRTVCEIAMVVETSLSEAVAVVAALVSCGLAFDVCDDTELMVDGNQFTQICRSVYLEWKIQLFSHPLWVRLATGEASRTVFMGWLLESYHFIEGANVRMPLAVSECASRGIREVLAHHYVEEWDHGAFFLKSLNEFGIQSDVVFAARPLPTTREVLNYMRRCARLGPLYYAVCSGFLESTGTDRANAREFYARLTMNYAEDRPQVIKPMADHTDLDEAYGHGDMLELMVEHMESLSIEEASRVVEVGAVFVELLELWSTDILRTYSQPGAKVRLTNEPYRTLVKGIN